MNIMTGTMSSYKPCEKCGKNNYKPLNMFCEDCKPKFRKPKCYNHVFSVLNMQSDRIIKCNTKECSETRKG